MLADERTGWRKRVREGSMAEKGGLFSTCHCKEESRAGSAGLLELGSVQGLL